MPYLLPGFFGIRFTEPDAGALSVLVDEHDAGFLEGRLYFLSGVCSAA